MFMAFVKKMIEQQTSTVKRGKVNRKTERRMTRTLLKREKKSSSATSNRIEDIVNKKQTKSKLGTEIYPTD